MHIRYINNVSGASTTEAPPEFRGGLLADDMGLGKTLSMISLIAADQACPDLQKSTSPGNFGYLPSVVLKTTLLVVPPACRYANIGYCFETNISTVIQSWEKQFSMLVVLFPLEQYPIIILVMLTLCRHLRAGVLRRHVYHGQNRTCIEFLSQYDVVITTYHTISAIWRKHGALSSSNKSIFSLTWHRVILDEGGIALTA
jgi:SWI/SNF-related matrix-associated actin-dependent regulator of chromatin subfamily A3